MTVAPELREVEAPRREAGNVGEGRPVDPFERQDGARRAVPVRRRHAEAGVVRDVLGHLGQGRRLEPKIHLEGDGARQRVDDLDRAQAA